MGVRAKFRVERHEHHTYAGGYESTKIVLMPNYDPSIPEDQRFQSASPSGELWMIVTNPAAIEQLQPGKYFYIDFTPADA